MAKASAAYATMADMFWKLGSNIYLGFKVREFNIHEISSGFDFGRCKFDLTFNRGSRLQNEVKKQPRISRN